MSRWIRLDTTWSSSGWIAALSPASRLVWVEILCYIRAHGVDGRAKRLTPEVVSSRYVTGVTCRDVTALLDAAIDDGALKIDGGDWVITNRDVFVGDPTSAVRSRRYRESKSRLSPSRDERARSVTSRDATPTVTVTDTDTELHSAARDPLDPENPWDGLDPLVSSSLRGLYGGGGRTGTDEAVWRDGAGVDREACLATAIMRWRSEGHAEFRARLFRRILESVIEEQSKRGGGEALWP